MRIFFTSVVTWFKRESFVNWDNRVYEFNLGWLHFPFKLQVPVTQPVYSLITGSQLQCPLVANHCINENHGGKHSRTAIQCKICWRLALSYFREHCEQYCKNTTRRPQAGMYMCEHELSGTILCNLTVHPYSHALIFCTCAEYSKLLTLCRPILRLHDRKGQ